MEFGDDADVHILIVIRLNAGLPMMSANPLSLTL